MPPDRRRYLKWVALLSTAGAAGCIGDGQPDEPSDTPTAATGGRTESPMEGTPGTSTATDETPPNDTDAVGNSIRTEYDPRKKYARPGGLVDDFEDLGRWQGTMYGSFSAETDRQFVGSQSLHVRGPDGGHGLVERPIPTTDMSDVDLSLALYTPDTSDVALFIRLRDADGNQAMLELRKMTYRQPDVGWFRTAPGVFSTDDEMDFTRVERIELQVNNASSGTVQAWIDDLRAHPKPDTGYVVLSWDDGHSDYTRKAALRQEKYGFPGVTTLPPKLDALGTWEFATAEELRERSAAGDDVASHGTAKRTWNTLSPSKLDEKLRRRKRWLVENDIKGAKFAVYPGNGFDDTSLSVVGRYHYMGGMNQSGNVNTTGVYGFDPLVLPRTIGGELKYAKRLVDNVAKYRNCGILNFHRFDGDNTMNLEQYEELLAYIDDKGDAIEVITFTDLWEMRRENHDAVPDVPIVTDQTA